MDWIANEDAKNILSFLRDVAFLGDTWNKKARLSSISEDEHSFLHSSFCDGDVSEIISMCRKADNSPYSADERESMESDLESHARTLNLPYCFCDGARALELAVIDALADHVNDIEVGVYVSKVGGDVAEWHCDNNHNITIQLSGSKEWQVLPGGERRAEGSRGMFDAPRNRAEQVQQRALPSTANAASYSLATGSVLYLPPGEWHRVVPTGDPLSVSIDIRIGNLTAARWLSEAMHATLGSLNIPRQVVGPSNSSILSGSGGSRSSSRPDPCSIRAAWDPTTPSGSLGTLLLDEGRLHSLIKSCPVPRPLPCEPELSDGLNRVARLESLPDGPSLPSWTDAVCLSSLVALTLKLRDGSTLLVSLTAVSSLSNYEYLRFGILCDAALKAPLEELLNNSRQDDIQTGTASLAELQRKCAPGSRPQLQRLVRCLTHANVLVPSALDGVEPPDAAATVGGKRRRAT